jgi:hypothetical protein
MYCVSSVCLLFQWCRSTASINLAACPVGWQPAVAIAEFVSPSVDISGGVSNTADPFDNRWVMNQNRCYVGAIQTDPTTGTAGAILQLGPVDGTDHCVSVKCDGSTGFLGIGVQNCNVQMNLLFTCYNPTPTANPCASVICGVHGSCVAGTCSCTDGYTGSTCSLPPPATCTSVNCGTHGSCVAGTCSCTDGYTGSTCSLPPPATCTNVNCGTHGSCVAGTCSCTDGYTGSTCSLPPPATSVTCPVGQTCTSGTCFTAGGFVSSVTCSCYCSDASLKPLTGATATGCGAMGVAGSCATLCAATSCTNGNSCQSSGSSTYSPPTATGATCSTTSPVASSTGSASTPSGTTGPSTAATVYDPTVWLGTYTIAQGCDETRCCCAHTSTITASGTSYIITGTDLSGQCGTSPPGSVQVVAAAPTSDNVAYTVNGQGHTATRQSDGGIIDQNNADARCSATLTKSATAINAGTSLTSSQTIVSQLLAMLLLCAGTMAIAQ